MRVLAGGWYPCYALTLILVLMFTISNIYSISRRTLTQQEFPSPTTTVEVLNSELDYQVPDDADVSISVPISKIMSGQPVILAQDDKRVIDYIWSKGFLQPPAVEGYNLSEKTKNPSMGQGQYIQRILKNQTDGFFVECGALDGETRSNTLFLEKNLAWRGLLVEGDPSNMALLLKKNRKAWVANTCLSIHPYPHTANFLQQFSTGKLLNDKEADSKDPTTYVSVQCVPLFTLLSALKVTTVDYFSLDVEGSELQVLKTIPFDQVFIRTLSVEFSHTQEGKENLISFMEGKGYRVDGEVRNEYGYANDIMFVNQNV